MVEVGETIVYSEHGAGKIVGIGGEESLVTLHRLGCIRTAAGCCRPTCSCLAVGCAAPSLMGR
jgi:hypothetical protein